MLITHKNRKGQVWTLFDRWCFQGSMDGWFHLSYAKPLAELAMKFVRHIGQKSFYELF